jgi:hypothetical protein
MCSLKDVPNGTSLYPISFAQSSPLLASHIHSWAKREALYPHIKTAILWEHFKIQCFFYDGPITNEIYHYLLYLLVCPSEGGLYHSYLSLVANVPPSPLGSHTYLLPSFLSIDLLPPYLQVNLQSLPTFKIYKTWKFLITLLQNMNLSWGNPKIKLN